MGHNQQSYARKFVRIQHFISGGMDAKVKQYVNLKMVGADALFAHPAAFVVGAVVAACLGHKACTGGIRRHSVGHPRGILCLAAGHGRRGILGASWEYQG